MFESEGVFKNEYTGFYLNITGFSTPEETMKMHQQLEHTGKKI